MAGTQDDGGDDKALAAAEVEIKLVLFLFLFVDQGILMNSKVRYD